MQSAFANINAAVSSPNEGLAPHKRASLIGAAFVLLPTIILAGAWRLGGVSALEDDLLYYLPIRQYIGERIASGEWPLWNPLVGMGTSIAADPQAGLWYPATYLFVALPPLIAYPVTVILHFALAGWGMYRFLRAGGRPWQDAFFGAIAFEFCGFLVAHRVHLTMHEAVAWIPWILYAWRRFADTGGYRHFALACVAFGLQMLVQHTQISIMTAIVVSAYVAIVLLPSRISLVWNYPLGMTIGAALGAVQTLPTLLQLGATGRGVATFSTFVENSLVPTSAIMMLFPMVFGNRTPTFWGQEWWGLSHFCEQFAYGSILVLVLSVASYGLIWRGKGQKDGDSASLQGIARREILFWWGACAVALIIALGEFTPLSRLLFHVPIYRNLRVPARWVLVWSIGMPVLASAVLSAIRQGGPGSERATTAVRWVGTRLLPAAAVVCAAILLIARWRVGDLETAFGHRWGMAPVFAGLRSAIRPSNPAIGWPLLVMAVSVGLVLRWAKRRDPFSFALLFGVMLVDLASVAGFVDVDTKVYRRADLINVPPLAEAIQNTKPEPGQRLLVPRYQADYARPVEVLWPETNLRQGVATFNAYGPFWPKANRLLFRFMPWGSSEAMLELLRNQKLCAAMGIRFLAARTAEEQEIIAAANAPGLAEPLPEIQGTQEWSAVQAGKDLLWPVRLDEPGIYELRFEAAPGPDATSQWYVRLETGEARQIGFARRLEPVDLSEGPRELRFLFVCPEPVERACIRVKSEMGQALSTRRVRFGRTAGPPVNNGAGQPGAGYLSQLTETANGIRLYENPEASPLVRIARGARPVATVAQAVAELLAEKPSVDPTVGVVYEWRSEWGEPPVLGEQGRVQYERLRGGELAVVADCPASGLMVFNESYDPGWSAEIDGKPARLHRVNAVVQGVIVPVGRSRVVFRYCPAGLAAGSLISLVAMGGLACGFVGSRWFSGRVTPPNPESSIRPGA